MSINLTRDSEGRIKSNNSNIILRGGHYWIFKDADNPGRCLVKPGQTLPFAVEYNNVPPCQTSANRFPVEELMWGAGGDMLIAHMNQFNCNFLRLWMTGGTLVSGSGAEPKPLDLTPFTLARFGTVYKWQVFNAINADLWNEAYFQRLNAFAKKAEDAGIVLQISLFNYVDLSSRFDGGNFRGWSRSPFNPAMSDHPAQYPNWAKNHLVNPTNINDEKARQAFFLAPTNNLWKVQESIIMKTVQTLSERTNIIYEIMNEPRGTHLQAAEFYSRVVGYILKWANGKRPLISVNASNLYAEPNTTTKIFDVDYWRNNNAAIKNYEKLDAISYHGLTGYPAVNQSVCGATTGVPIVDPGAIQSRFNKHRSGHSSKSLIYCTDAARTGQHDFPGTNGVQYELQIRDGQIVTNYTTASDPPPTQRIKSDLEDWAYWCFNKAVPNAGQVHFQNHSLNQTTYRRMRDALNHAIAVPASFNEAEPAETEIAAPEMVE
jgi:Cellulase (glycosyl hydrolase family 5)